MFEDAEVISRYTRAEAIEDGVLVDISETARECGFKFPVAMTRDAFEDCVTWDEGNAGLQDESGRLWDVVWMGLNAIRRCAPGTDRLPFDLYRIPNTPRATTPRRTTLVLHIGPGDTPEPVMTIMLPGES
jgi:hypothetical protein